MLPRLIGRVSEQTVFKASKCCDVQGPGDLKDEMCFSSINECYNSYGAAGIAVSTRSLLTVGADVG